MTALSILRPFREVTSLPEHIQHVFHEMDSLEQSLLAPMSLAPKTDVYEDADRIVLEVEAPGLREEDLNLTLEANVLTISGERKRSADRKEGRYQRMERAYGSFSRTFTLPSIVDANSIEAKYEHGILHVSMAKRADARPRQIKLNSQAKQLTA